MTQVHVMANETVRAPTVTNTVFLFTAKD